MKKEFRSLLAGLCLPVLLAGLQGCLKDTSQETYTIYTPVYQSLTKVRSAMHSGPALPLQNTGKLNVFGRYIFLNEINKGIHVIDNANPAAPKNMAFIPVPANVDLAVRGSFLYADSYSDIVVFDISQPADIRAVAFLNNVIKDKNRYWYNQTDPDSVKVVVGYTAKDTTVSYPQYRQWSSCSNCMYASADLKSFFSTSVPQVGVSGSMSRFAIAADYLYAVSGSALYALSLQSPASPQLTSTRQMGWNIETIYPFGNTLFIGSRTGMFVYGLSNPAAPAQLSQFTHATSCDPVISDGEYAYVTLHAGTTCGGTLNQLDVLDVSNLSNPVLKKTVALGSPHGLAKDGNLLFVCDGKEGLKLFDAASPTNPQLKLQVKGLETYDIIAGGGNAVVVAKDGLYQFAYSNGSLTQRSKLSVSTNN